MNNENRHEEPIPLNPICQVSRIKNTTYIVTGTYTGDTPLDTKITNILKREMGEIDERFYGT